ncbi:hypothetical protein SUGI_1293520 [Cryptomeria japonica]|uniref:TIR domain-containing protein n=2 Tax=Cryptomeria japonica TaxID=3369 RepID=A0AAD3NNZ9_CRYJA|nr:hypothetical protein SUGI_1293520 [Cryptomeria japonica]
MASSSSSHQQNRESKVFSGIEPDGKRRKVEESATLFDVFINHRGTDVKQTLATQLYNSLDQLGIWAFLDSEEKDLGSSFPSMIETAIRSAKVHVAIFSPRYAESAWCLAELVLMLQSTAKIIPVFYGVKPSDLRHIEKGAYADAFLKFKEKGRYLDNISEWKEALQSLSFIAGEEINSEWDCQNIGAAVQKEVRRKTSLHVAEHPVGLNNLVEDFERRCLDELVQDFQNQCGLEDRKHKGRVVGIFGMGGCGKTTLAKELFNRKKSNYSGASFLFDVREADLRCEMPSLQSKLLKDLFNADHNLLNTEEGASYLKDSLQRSPHLSFLIVVDDIDNVEQLNALQIMDILNKSDNSLIIVTTRDVGVLVTAGITVAYNLKGMGRDDGRELFCWHAFDRPYPESEYEELVNSFVELCGGLPLSLQVLGRHVHGRNGSYWRLELIKVGKPKSIAERVWEGSGWNPQHALETLKDKCLLERQEILKYEGPVLRMHDHLRDLGREMAIEFSPPHRLWRPQDLKSLESKGFDNILANTNFRCFHSIFDKSMGSQVTFFLSQPKNCSEMSASLLWLQLQPNSTEQPSIPSWIPLQNLQCLKIEHGQFKKLWNDSIQAPSELKELQLSQTSLKEFPDLLGISKDSLENLLENGEESSISKASMNSLEKLEIKISGEKCVSKILISSTDYPNLRSLKLHGMENLMEVNLIRVEKLSCLDIRNCRKLKTLTGTSDLKNLELLHVSQCPDLEFESLCLRDMKCLKRASFGKHVKLKTFELYGCQNLKTTEFSCEKLVDLSIRDCPKLKNLPDLIGPSCLERILIDGCGKFENLKLDGCRNLRSVTGNFEPTKLYICGSPQLKELPVLATLTSLSIKCCKDLQRVSGTGDFMELTELIISECPTLEKLPSLARLSFMEKFMIESCEKLQNISGIEELNASEYMRLCYCSNAVIWNCIHKLKSVPRRMDMIARAAQGAESLLNESLFSDARIDAHAVTDIVQFGAENSDDEDSDDERRNGKVLSAVFVCFVVEVDSFTSVNDINQALPQNAFRLEVREGGWIITMVESDDWGHSSYCKKVSDVLRRYGVMKKGFRVELKKYEESKSLEVLHKIVDKLHHGCRAMVLRRRR